jgi:hypothetical protein
MDVTLTGDIPEDLAPPYCAFLQQLVAQTPHVAVFVDAEHLVNYETGFRQRCTKAHRAGGTRIVAHHVLVASKLVAVSFQAVKFILPNMVAHTLRASFDAALAKAIAERARPAITASTELSPGRRR